MTSDEQQAVFNSAVFFNKEISGLRIADLTKDEKLYKNYKALAVFVGKEGSEDNVIAIAEGIKVPLYAFAYGIELV